MGKLITLSIIIASLCLATSASAYQMELTSPSDGQSFNATLSPALNSWAVETTFTVDGYEDDGDLDLQYWNGYSWQLTNPYQWTSAGDGTASITTFIPAILPAMKVRALTECPEDGYCEEECSDDGQICYSGAAPPITLNISRPADQVLTSRLGKLRIGMSLKQARKATKIKLEKTSFAGCRYGEALNYGVSVMFLRQKVARFDIDLADNFYLANGLRFGMSLSEAKQKTPRARQIQADPNFQAQFPLSKKIWGRYGGNKLGGVYNMSLGTKQATSLVEGCL